MKVTKVNLYKDAAGNLFEKVSNAQALEADNVQKAIEGEGETAKKFFVVPYVAPPATK